MKLFLAFISLQFSFILCTWVGEDYIPDGPFGLEENSAEDEQDILKTELRMPGVQPQYVCTCTVL